MPLPPWRDLTWFIEPFRSLYAYLLSSEINAFILLALSLSILGLISLMWRNWVLGMAVLMPIVITLFASGFQKYPFWERLLLFLAPVIYLFIAEGIERILLFIKPRSLYFSYGLVALLWIIVSFPSIAQSIHTFKVPNRREDFKHVMIHLQQNLKEGDQIYLFHFTFPAFEYYSTFYKIPTENIIYGSAAVGRKETYKYTEDLETLCNKYPNGRIWVVLTHARPFEFVVFKDFFKTHGTLLDKFLVQGSNLYLYKMHCNG